MRSIIRVGGALVGAVIIGMSGGCSTVIFTDSNVAADRASAIEREALIEAASAVSETKWPQPTQIAWQARLSPLSASEDVVTEADAAEAYLSSIRVPGRRHEQVYADAEAHLRAAAALARAADAATNSVRPVKADIAVVEDAIGSLRQTRDIYVLSLKALARHGEPVEAENVRALKDDFDDAIKALGSAADALADRVARDRTKTFAGPVRSDPL